jgi:hypothetical protein
VFVLASDRLSSTNISSAAADEIEEFEKYKKKRKR